MTSGNGSFMTVLDTVPTRCSIVMDESLTGFHLSNAIARSASMRHAGACRDSHIPLAAPTKKTPTRADR